MRRLTSLVAVFLLGGCSALLNLGELQGGDAGVGLSDGGAPLADASLPDAAPVDASLPDAGAGPFDASLPDASLPDAGPCIPVACTDNPGAPCTRGEIRCDTGAPVCVDATPADDGTTCARARWRSTARSRRRASDTVRGGAASTRAVLARSRPSRVSRSAGRGARPPGAIWAAPVEPLGCSAPTLMA